MKLKSLLLGSAAALALSTGAQAADPTFASVVSLGVCDALGISGLVIESDDTCLRISGEVEYEFDYEYVDALGVGVYDSYVDWNLQLAATTQIDTGSAAAVIRLVEGSTGGSSYDDVGFDRAFVQLVTGDTTFTAGRIGSLVDYEILDKTYSDSRYNFADFDVDENDLVNTVRFGGHGIQVEQVVADGFTVLAALEDLQANGTALLGVEYSGSGISAEIGVAFGDLFDNTPVDPINFFATIEATFDAFTGTAGILVDDTGFWIAQLGVEATFDLFTLEADAVFDDAGDWLVVGKGTFAATDTVDVYVAAAYLDQFGVESFTVFGGVEVEVTETIAVVGEVGYVDFTPGGDHVYGLIGATYAPGGNFETSVTLEANTDGDYAVNFLASKSF